MMAKLKSIINNIISTLERYSTLLVAVATVFLAVFTGFYIWETRQMRIETKRLVDLSIEQFKIRAYPTFMIEFEDVKYESDEMTTVLKIHNKGEINANKVTFLWVYGYSNPSIMMIFFNNYGTYSGVEKKHTSLDYPLDIYRNAHKKITSIGKLHKNFTVENLKYAVLFIRFWVPYDNQYRYETFGYKLERDTAGDNRKLLSWQATDMIAEKNFIDNYFKNRKNFDERIKSFFQDFQAADQE